MEFQFTNIKAVIPRLPIPKSEYDISDVIEWAMQGLELMNAVQPYQRQMAFLEVSNHTTTLPLGVVRIEVVAKPHGELPPTAEEIEELTQCEIDYINKQHVDRIQHQGIINNYNLFIQSDYFSNYFSIMRLANRPFTDKFHCELCPNFSSNCQYEYSIDHNGKITTSFESGHICVGILTHVKDEDGNFMIPDDENLLQALAAYVTARFWEQRMHMKEQGAAQLHQMALNKAEVLMARCRGIWITKDFNYKDYEDIVYKNIKWANSASIFNRRHHGTWVRTR